MNGTRKHCRCTGIRKLICCLLTFFVLFLCVRDQHAKAESFAEAGALRSASISAQGVPAFSSGNAAAAASYALIEMNTHSVLAQTNMNSRLPMASTTKTMTALIVIENCDLDELVTVADEAVGTEGSSMYLRYDEVVSVRDLLYGLMLLSGNDAAIALAVHVGGSVEGFVEMMNGRAERMGLSNTHFVTPNGLHDNNHYTTAYELALIGAEAMKNETFREIVSTQYHTASTGSIQRTMKNKNSLLWDYEGGIGIKTGYTMAAGRCLLFAAERDGMTLVGAVLNCRPMFEAAADLLDYGFENYSLCTALNAGAEIARCYVPNALESILPLTAESDIIIAVPKGKALEIELRLDLSKAAAAPIIKGEILGTAELYLDDEFIGRTNLIAAKNIASRDFTFYLRLMINAMTR